MPIDLAALRSAFGRFATGVTIVTCLDPKGQRVGLTVNSFSSLSLDPALVLWSLRTSSQALPAFVEAGHFAVNVLAEAQMPLSRRFASPTPDRFAEGEWSPGEGGSPVLAQAAAVFECATEQRITVGDHELFVGRVLRLHEHDVPPLVFQAGHYRHLGRVI